jgi:hypothetical protein
MNHAEIQDYKMRVANILKVFRHTYGLDADLVNVNSRTIGSKTFVIMKTILEEKKIAIEIDDRVLVGKFMFVNRELSASDML